MRKNKLGGGREEIHAQRTVKPSCFKVRWQWRVFKQGGGKETFGDRFRCFQYLLGLVYKDSAADLVFDSSLSLCLLFIHEIPWTKPQQRA